MATGIDNRIARGVLMLLAVVSVAFLSACGGGSSAPPNIYIADENDNGQTVTMAVGDALQLSLPENPSTGYVWSVVTNNETILRPDEDPAYTPVGTVICAPVPVRVSGDVQLHRGGPGQREPATHPGPAPGDGRGSGGDVCAGG